ncbi:MAG: AAA family ATPase [Chloroflexota bacterium]|nr:AAA family ATPase [Chloroflexota bacterium]
MPDGPIGGRGVTDQFAYGSKPLLEVIDDSSPPEIVAAERRAIERKRALNASGWLEPEDRGLARLSTLGTVEYVEDWLRPGRIVTWAAEEGAGKTFAMAELGIRLALAGGSFAGTWPVLALGPVLVLSEMHPDDDYQREATILESLGFARPQLAGGYYRLPLMTAAGGEPPLKVDAWRGWVTGWLREQNALALIVDTATAATNVDPWGPEIQGVYHGLRLMLDEYPELAIVLVVHLKKPQGRGERRISDVLGEWGRWCDVLVLQENDGASLTRTKLTVRKRVRRERRIIATKSGGLLVDPEELQAAGPKVPLGAVLEAIAATPGIDAKALGALLGVSKSTAGRYAAMAEEIGQVRHDERGSRGAFRYFTGEESDAELLAQVAS